VQAVVNIAKARSMTTTAEGVETEQQREILFSCAARKCRAICSGIRTLLFRANNVAAAEACLGKGRLPRDGSSSQRFFSVSALGLYVFAHDPHRREWRAKSSSPDFDTLQ